MSLRPGNSIQQVGVTISAMLMVAPQDGQLSAVPSETVPHQLHVYVLPVTIGVALIVAPNLCGDERTWIECRRVRDRSFVRDSSPCRQTSLSSIAASAHSSARWNLYKETR